MLPRTALFVFCLIAQSLIAYDESKLAGIQAAMQKAVEAKQAAGIVTLVMEKGRVIHHEATGWADISKGQKMKKDDLFWIASMTKSVNAAAIMILVDEGKLNLDEPASQWLPELANVKLADGSAPEKAITLRMLLSHTAGIAFPPRKPTDGAISLKNYVKSLLSAPLAFQPGSSYEYGFGPTVAGRILEIVSQQKYEQFLQERLFAPLGMTDTLFHLDEARRARVARTYKMDEDSHELVPGYNPFLTSDVSVTHMTEPSGGLFSTAADMGRFYAMIAALGESNGKRILSEKSVKDMTRPVNAGGKPLNYACGWQCNIATQRVCAAMPVGSFGHGGAFATNGWIDPERQIATVFLVQNVLVPDGGKARDSFQKIVMESFGVRVPPPNPKK